MAKAKHDWAKLDPAIDQRRAQGWNDTQIAKDLRIGRQTLVDHLRSRAPDTPAAHPSTPVHQGTLEEHQEVIEEVHQSVPDAPHLSADEVPLSTPIVHPEVSPDDSTLAHSSGPARQEQCISPPMVHLGPPTEDDWLLWTAMKGRWGEIEKMLTEWQSRRTLLSTPSGTPRHTMKKTYVVDSLYVELIDRYAQEQGVELKDVVNLAFQEFFERREFLPEERKTP
jgi:hypothetical protein